MEYVILIGITLVLVIAMWLVMLAMLYGVAADPDDPLDDEIDDQRIASVRGELERQETPRARL